MVFFNMGLDKDGKQVTEIDGVSFPNWELHLIYSLL